MPNGLVSPGKGCGSPFSPFVGFFSERGKRYSRDLVQSLVLSALTVSYHETSRRAEREAGVKAAAITVWRELREAYQKYERRQKKAPSSRGLLVADSTGVKTGKTRRGSPLNLAIKVTGRKVKTAFSMLREAFTRPSIRMEPMGNGRTGRGDSGGSFGNHRLRE